MVELLLGLVVLLGLLTVVLLLLIFQRVRPTDLSPMTQRFDALERALERLERSLTEPLALQRQEAAEGARQLREEVARSIKQMGDTSMSGLREVSEVQKNQLESFAHRLSQLTANTEQRLTEVRQSSEQQLTQMRQGTEQQLQTMQRGTEQKLSDMRLSIDKQLSEMRQSSEQKNEQLRSSVETKLTAMQQDNAQKLELMRQTVDEKLQGTLEKRLGDSFKLVSERLELVHKGLGEMQTLAGGVGDLKRVLTNVKTRGTWGEWQLGTLLEQLLSPQQYEQNVATKPDSGERVEFVIKMPGRGDNGLTDDSTVMLPIDAKFPQEDYQRLIEATEQADPVGVEEAIKQLETRIKSMAKDIRDKYINEPVTTNFAIMYLPTEGLFAEVARRPGLLELLQRDYRVSVAGPTTLAAYVNALQMGFRTLAIQKRSAEVWETLGVVKTEFGKFGEVLANVKTKLEQATSTIEKAETRTRAIERKLKNVQALPIGEGAGQNLLETAGGDDES